MPTFNASSSACVHCQVYDHRRKPTRRWVFSPNANEVRRPYATRTRATAPALCLPRPGLWSASQSLKLLRPCRPSAARQSTSRSFHLTRLRRAPPHHAAHPRLGGKQGAQHAQASARGPWPFLGAARLTRIPSCKYCARAPVRRSQPSPRGGCEKSRPSGGSRLAARAVAALRTHRLRVVILHGRHRLPRSLTGTSGTRRLAPRSVPALFS